MKTTNPEVDAIEKLKKMIRNNYPNAMFIPPGEDFPNPFRLIDQIQSEMNFLKSSVKILNKQLDELDPWREER